MDLQASGRAMECIAVALVRSKGLDITANPQYIASTLSPDGMQSTITFGLPNGGSLVSYTVGGPSVCLVWSTTSESAEGYGTDSNNAPFTVTVVGKNIVATKASDTWSGPESVKITFNGLSPRTATEAPKKIAICDGWVYQTGRSVATSRSEGNPVMGALDGSAKLLESKLSTTAS